MKLRLPALLICSALIPLTANAVDPLELVITPTRTATPLKAIGSSVSVITAKDIEQKQYGTVAEALREVPGLSISPNGGRGQTTSVFIRGAKSEHTLVLIDGVEMNDPSATANSYDFSRLSTDNIERIEVLRGSQSTLYGTDAIGGVISITTKKGAGPVRYTGLAEYGSYNSSRLQAGVSGGNGDVSFSALVGNDYTSGFSAFNEARGGVEDDPSRTTTFSGRLDAKINDRFGAYATTRYTGSRTEFDGFGEDARNLNEGEEFSVRAAGTAKMWDGKWTQEFGVSFLNIERNVRTDFGGAFFDSLFEGERAKLDWVHTLTPFESHVITGGVETEHDRSFSDFEGKQTTSNRAAFIQDQWNIVENLYVTAGVRVDDHEAFGSEFTYRIAPTYTIPATQTQLKASYGTGFKAPTLYQLYSFYGNINLDPEKSRGFDVGFEQPLLDNRLRFGSTYFHNSIEDLIDFNFATNSYFNTNDANTQGVESFISYSPIPALLFSFTHTYTLAENEFDDTELVRRPRHKITFDANWNVTDAARIGATFDYMGVRRDYDLGFNPVRVGGHPLLSLNGDWDLSPNVTLFGRVVNLLDREYETVYGYGTEELLGYAGVRVRY